jgi:hypothetical protein
MKKTGKPPFKLDERDLNIFYRICTVMYLLTIYGLMGVQLYRQFVLHQPHQQWDDIAMILVINVFVLIASFLFISGDLNLKKIKLSWIIGGYIGFVLLGLSFTVFKYTILLGQGISLSQVWDYLMLVIKISGLLVIGLILLAYLGNRRIEKQIE